MTRTLSSLAVSILCMSGPAFAQAPGSDGLLYGVAYYDEYMPYDRLEQDVRMMKEAGIDVVRIAESTWSTVEPQDGTFDFTHIDRVLDAMHRASIRLIVGTPSLRHGRWTSRASTSTTPRRRDSPVPRSPSAETWRDCRRGAC